MNLDQLDLATKLAWNAALQAARDKLAAHRHRDRNSFRKEALDEELLALRVPVQPIQKG